MNNWVTSLVAAGLWFDPIVFRLDASRLNQVGEWKG